MFVEAVLIAITALLLMYFRSRIKTRNNFKIYWKRNKRNTAILARCSKLNVGFQPTFWAINSHIQTLLGCASHFFGNNFQFRKEILLMRDGGTITLEWYINFNNNSYNKKSVAGTSPLLLISGWIIGPDIERICKSVAKQGYQPVVYKSRGRGIPLTSTRMPDYLDAADFSEAIDYIHALFPFSDLFVVGYSLGCAPILGYLGVKGKASLITSAVCISTTIDLESILNGGIKMPYVQIITEYFKKLICSNSSLDNTEIRNWRSFRDIFKYGFSAIHPYTNLEGYIRINNPLSYVGYIRTPTLFINSIDDPVIETPMQTHTALKNNNYIIEVLTDTGGHCGFSSGLLATSWSTEAALEFHGAVLHCRSLLLSPVKNGCKRLRSITR